VNVIVFSDNRRLRKCFRVRGAAKTASSLGFAGWREFRKLVPAIQEPTLCYLDVSKQPKGKLAGCLRLLARNPRLAYGLIDPGGELSDPARAFHDGAADYLDREALREGIDGRRLARAWAYSLRTRADTPGQESRAPASGAVYLPSGSDWSQVRPGREYTFCLLFIELDGKEEMERRYGMRNLSIALSSFRSYIENSVKSCHGRLWIWSSFGGIVLFPFNGRDCPALSFLFRLVLFRHLYDIEESQFPNFLSYRLALHLGNLVYTDRNVGSVVSDSLNSVFHLGQQFARPGGFYLTEEALGFGPPALKPFFLEAGEFEGRKILRMRLPVHRER
jgi:hypothetical protein